jgi:MerR family transcriptional regulator/heat shock protein HspR
MLKRKKGYFSISAVAKMFSVHQQTIRLYEKEGLIIPKRSSGNTRLFSEEDVDRLEEIIYLTHQLGINLAGVEMIFKLKKQMAKMQKDMNKIFDATQKELETEAENSKHMVSTSAKQLMKIKKNITIDTAINPDPVKHDDHFKPTEESQSKIFDVDDWEIEYDE